MIDIQTALLLPEMVSAAHMDFGWRRIAARFENIWKTIFKVEKFRVAIDVL